MGATCPACIQVALASSQMLDTTAKKGKISLTFALTCKRLSVEVMITLASREFVLSSLELCEWRTSLVCLLVRVSVRVWFVGFRVNIIQSVYLYMSVHGVITDTSWRHVQLLSVCPRLR
jgi:hypothetical protein